MIKKFPLTLNFFWVVYRYTYMISDSIKNKQNGEILKENNLEFSSWWYESFLHQLFLFGMLSFLRKK